MVNCPGSYVQTKQTIIGIFDHSIDRLPILGIFSYILGLSGREHQCFGRGFAAERSVSTAGDTTLCRPHSVSIERSFAENIP